MDKKKTKTVKKKRVLKLNRRERLFLKELTSSPNISIAQAARNAGYAEGTVRSDIYSKVHAKPSVQTAIADIMEKQGLTDDKLTSKLKEGLEATKVISCNVIASDGEGMKDANSMTKDFVDTPDYATQHKFLDTALKLKDKYPASKNEHTGKDGGPLNFAYNPVFKPVKAEDDG